MVSLHNFKKTFFKFEDTVDFHFALMNIVILVRESTKKEVITVFVTVIVNAGAFLSENVVLEREDLDSVPFAKCNVFSTRKMQ